MSTVYFQEGFTDVGQADFQVREIVQRMTSSEPCNRRSRGTSSKVNLNTFRTHSPIP